MKIVLIVIDGFGVGKEPQSESYGDFDVNTYKHIVEKTNLKLPNLFKLGLDNIDGLDLKKNESPMASFGKMQELSKGKDTTTGHWEIAGIVSEKGFPTFPNGFPNELIDQLEKTIGTKVLCCKPYSGTEVIKDYGEEHLRTGFPIVYTSADSVMQIACHCDVIPTEILYMFCKLARKICKGEYAVSRIIARPFATVDGKFVRTKDRRDFSLSPPNNLLDRMCDENFDVIGIGKIEDIFNFRGLTESYHTQNNRAGLIKIQDIMQKNIDGLIFANLVDTDMLYGHRNDTDGYKSALLAIDEELPKIIDLLSDEDYLIITSDHGCDPTDTSTDHSREYVPLLIYNKNERPVNLGTIKGFNYVSNFISEKFKIRKS